MAYLNREQIRLISSLFSNLSIVWLAAAVINPTNMDVSLKFIMDAIMSLTIAIYLLKGIDS